MNYAKMDSVSCPYGIMECKSVSTLHVDPYSASISMSVSIWILQSVKCPHTPCTLTVYIEYKCQPIISSNEKTHNQFAIDNNYLWKYPYIIKVIWNFAHESFLI